MSKNKENDKTKADLTTTQNITFDKEDGLLFSYSDDLLLKAKAIQNSILPKLQMVLQDAVSLIRTIYGVEVFDENSTITKRPNFRPKRETELKMNYTYAYTGIYGTRLPIWKNLKRIDERPVVILPVYYCLSLNENCIYIKMWFYKALLDKESIQKFFSVFIENTETIQAILNLYGFEFNIPYAKKNLFMPLRENIKEISESYTEDLFRIGITKIFPLPIVDKEQLDEIKLCFAALFPIYDSLLRVAKGEQVRFDELVQKLSDYMVATFESKAAFDNRAKDTAHDNFTSKSVSYSTIKENALKKIDNIGIRTSIRWQVFERDNFRCVACGAGAAEGAILHVDHILPRSKGGKDTMSNYQTLCWKCNIGKSNKSDRNLRGEK